MKSSVIVPVYNESATVESIVRRIAAVPMKKGIIVVDDESTDGTREIVMDLKKRIKLFLYVVCSTKGTRVRGLRFARRWKA